MVAVPERSMWCVDRVPDDRIYGGVLWDRYLAPNQHRIVVQGLSTDESHARALIMFWAGLHDVGKATPSFQRQNENASVALRRAGSYEDAAGDGSLRHGTAGQLALPDLLAPLACPQVGRRASGRMASRVAQIVGGHHGRFQQTTGPHDGRLHLGRWDRQRSALVRVVHGAVGSPPPAVTLRMTLRGTAAEIAPYSDALGIGP